MNLVDPDRPYPMHLPRLGHAVIVNNVSMEMPGSMADVEALQRAYEAVGFQVHVHSDCNSQQMRSVKKFIMSEETHVDSNCLMVTVICHGNDKGQLLDRDKKKAWDTELFIGDLSDVDSLAGKPKIMIIQACRGAQVSEGRSARYLADEEDRESTNILPDKADMFLAYATVPGFKALGADHAGSVYLQALATYLQSEFMKRPLNKILQMVRQHVIQQLQGKQCPEERNSLIYDVMFSEFYARRPGATRLPQQTSGYQGQPTQISKVSQTQQYGGGSGSGSTPAHSGGDRTNYRGSTERQQPSWAKQDENRNFADSRTRTQENRDFGGGYRDVQPKIQDTQPKSPGFRSKYQDTQPKSSGFGSKFQDTQPKSPGFGSKFQDTQPKSPGFGSKFQDTQPKSPGFGSKFQDTQPTTPGFGSKYQDTQPSALGYGSAYQDTQPTAPGFGSKYQENQPKSPEHGQYTQPKHHGSRTAYQTSEPKFPQSQPNVSSYATDVASQPGNRTFPNTNSGYSAGSDASRNQSSGSSFATDYADERTPVRMPSYGNGTGNRLEQQMASVSLDGDISLRHIFTHSTGLKEVNSLTVLPSGDLVVCGREGRGKWAYHVFTLTNHSLELKVTLKVACKHETHVLPVGDNSGMWASCEFCKKIKHVDLKKDKTGTAYGGGGKGGDELWPGRLCEGESGHLMVYSLGKVLELPGDKSDKQKLSAPVKTIDAGLSNCAGICYVPTPRAVVLSDSSGGVVRAVACAGRKDDTLWEVKGVVDGRLCDPRGITNLGRRGGSHVLLVCDGANTRLLALEPRSGRHIQTIPLPDTTGEVHDICVHGDRVILHHTAENNNNNISLFSIQ